MEAQIAKMHEYRRKAKEKYEKEQEERKQREIERKKKEKEQAAEEAKAKAEGRELPKKKEEETKEQTAEGNKYSSRRDINYDDADSNDSEDDKVPRVLKSELDKKKQEKIEKAK